MGNQVREGKRLMRIIQQAWRMLSRSFMTPTSNKKLVAYTPMFHARMFGETSKFRDRMFQPVRSSLTTHPTTPSPSSGEILFLDGNPSIDRPLFVQFCANDPNELLDSAKYVTPFCDAVDLNLGCPQGIAKKGKYGAFLQEDQDLIFQLINKLHTELDIPVTAKIRILETREKTLAYAQNVLKAGASILTVHGRQREQKGHKTGLADWSVIRFLRENLPKETVLFANGNILKREDIDACLEATGADGVMSAEGNLYDPAIFAEAPAVGEEGREYWRGNDGKGGWRMDAVLRRYMDIIHKYVVETPIDKLPVRKPLYLPSDPELPTLRVTEAEQEEEGPPKKKQRRSNNNGAKERTTSPNLTAMQAHLFHLLRALVGKQTHVRDALAKCRSGDIDAFEGVLNLVEVACAKGIKEYHDSDGKSWEEEMERDEKAKKEKEEADAKAVRREDVKGNSGGGVKKTVEVGKVLPPLSQELDESSVETVRACKRPWWVVQPHVRPLPMEALAKGSLTLSKKERERVRMEGRDAVTASTATTTTPTVEDVKSGDWIPNGHVEVKKIGDGKEEVEIPKDGLVCG